MPVPRIYLTQEPAGLSGECAVQCASLYSGCHQRSVASLPVTAPLPTAGQLTADIGRATRHAAQTPPPRRTRRSHLQHNSELAAGQANSGRPRPRPGRLTGGLWVVCSRGSCRVGLISDPLLAVSETNKWLSKILKKSHDEIKGNRSPSEKC